MMPTSPPWQLQVVRWLEVGLIIRWGNLPGFRAAFDPGEIGWDEAGAEWRGESEEAARGATIHSWGGIVGNANGWR